MTDRAHLVHHVQAASSPDISDQPTTRLRHAGAARWDIAGAMTTLQEQARALGDPTRHAIFRHVAEAGRAGRDRRAHRALRVQPQRDPPAPRQARRPPAWSSRPRPRRRSGPPSPPLRRRPRRRGTVGYDGPVRAAQPPARRDHPHRLAPRGGRTAGRRPVPRAVAVGRRRRRRHSRDGAPGLRSRGALRAVAAPRSCCTTARSRPTALRRPRHGVRTASRHRGGAHRRDRVVVDELVAKDPRKADCRLRIRVGPDESEPEPTTAKLSLRGTTTKP